MKRTLSIIMAAAVAAACTVTAGAEGSELVVLGDSITSGYGLDGYVSGDNYSAAGSFANMLGTDFGGYENFAVDGRTSGELLTALEDADIAAALAELTQLSSPSAGNDFLQPMISAVQSAVMSDPDPAFYITWRGNSAQRGQLHADNDADDVRNAGRR